ncbi:response regulator [Sphingobium cloacae]|uniref:CheY-like response regulator n=1 Tax=Sphingobium cloacae TaxID=120107 RepID=A0A1E1F7B9_9SPHN|nr:response regulator [Sphingobium cloacae]BAV66311.1 CheY-like response regulator [Sphingobium cloacae]
MAERVLIVEDEILVALEIEQIVQDAGLDVIAIAADRTEALAAASRCDIALVDLNLRDGPTGPGIGMELARRHHVRVIYVTANPAQIGPASNVAIGCVTKPFDAQCISAALKLAVAKDFHPEDIAVSGFTPFPAAPGAWRGAESRR